MFELMDAYSQSAVIKVIGVGGGGGNAVAHMVTSGIDGVEFMCINTDAQALNRSAAHSLIQLGSTGLGAGAKPEAGKGAAEEAVDRIRQAIDGAHMLFITAGMGGGTGTGAAPVIARVAKEMGILTVGVVTKPFEFEGPRRMKSADSGLAELEANVDSLIVILNDKPLDVLGDDVTQDQAFAHANDVLKNAVGGISDIIHIPGLVNVDFEDVKTVMSEPGKAMMGTAQASGPDRANKAADAGLAELEANVDSLIVILNDKLLDVLGDDVTQDQAFAHANDVLKNAVGGISDIIHIPGLVNVDFEDVKTVMSEPGKAMMGTAIGRASCRERV